MAEEQTIEQLKAALKKEAQEKAALEEKLKESNAVIAEMQEQINDQSKALKSVKSFPTVSVDKQKYEIRIPGKVRFKGKEYTAEEISKSKDVAAELIKKKVSFISAVK